MQGQKRGSRNIPPQKAQFTATASSGCQGCWILHGERAACHRLWWIKPGTLRLGKAQRCWAQAQKAVLKGGFLKPSPLGGGDEMPLDFSRDGVRAELCLH